MLVLQALCELSRRERAKVQSYDYSLGPVVAPFIEEPSSVELLQVCLDNLIYICNI